MFLCPSDPFCKCDLVASNTNALGFLCLPFPVLEMSCNGPSFVLFHVFFELHPLDLPLVLTITICKIRMNAIIFSNDWNL